MSITITLRAVNKEGKQNITGKINLHVEILITKNNNNNSHIYAYDNSSKHELDDTRKTYISFFSHATAQKKIKEAQETYKLLVDQSFCAKKNDNNPEVMTKNGLSTRVPVYIYIRIEIIFLKQERTMKNLQFLLASVKILQ